MCLEPLVSHLTLDELLLWEYEDFHAVGGRQLHLLSGLIIIMPGTKTKTAFLDIVAK